MYLSRRGIVLSVKRKQRRRSASRLHCTIREAKTKALISFAVTAKLICGFVFAYANCCFSHAQAHMYLIVSFMVLSPSQHFTVTSVRSKHFMEISNTFVLLKDTATFGDGSFLYIRSTSLINSTPLNMVYTRRLASLFRESLSSCSPCVL